jgi:small subunit ribosomal protein S5
MDKVARVGAALLRRGLGSVAETARGGAPSTTGGWYANLANPTQCTRLGAFGPATRGYVSSTLPRFADDRFSPVFETPEMDKEYERLAVEIGKAPKKRQRFLLTEALKGTRLKPLIAAERELLKEDDEFKPRDLQTRVIDVNRTCKVTKGGGLMNFTALVIVGNGDGVVGFATGKGKDVSLAVEKAYLRASRSLVYIERFEKSTIFHAQEAKHCKTKIRLMPAKAGEGLRCNQIVESICEMAGITDLSAKVIGSHHPHNTVRACFEALERVQSPADVAAARGVTVYMI